MVKFGILTFYDALNYGAALQALALQQAVENAGVRAEFIRCLEAGSNPEQTSSKHGMLAYFHVLRKNRFSLKRFMRMRNVAQGKATRFSEFRERYMHLSRKAYYGIEDLKNQEFDYTGYICGSDMVWSDIGQNLDLYFLSFAPQQKRISYAPSLTGRDGETESEKEFYRDRINGIKYLSCRERYGVDYIKAITGKTAQLVLDPTLLLSKEQWCELLNLEQKQEEKPYILCYMFGGVSKEFSKRIAQLQQKYDMDVRFIPVTNYETEYELDRGINPDYGPREFVELFLNAEIVLTNSFHGLLFSLIMQKQFVVFHRDEANVWAKHEERLANILRILSLDDRYHYESEDLMAIKFDIDYDTVSARLDKQRQMSLKYLYDSVLEVAANDKAEESEGKPVGKTLTHIGELEPKKCTGCSACAFVCPTKSITLHENEEGYLHPVVNAKTCIECKKCLGVCQALSPVSLHYPEKTFCGYGKNEAVKNSASGGVFYTVAKWIIENKCGVVYGAAFDPDSFVCRHIAVETVDGLYKLQNSKYVQSNLLSVMEHCKSKLLEGRTVLFSGTPCQIAGLYKFLGREFDNLYTMDLICHGVPSPLFLKKRVENNNGKITSLKFRHRMNPSTQRSVFGMVIETENGEVSVIPSGQDFFSRHFLAETCYRESCYNCMYAQEKRTGDITIGDHDSWRTNGNFKQGLATSAIMINTNKGEELWESTSECFEYSEMNYEEECIANHQLRRPCVRPAIRSSFYKDMVALSWSEFVKKYTDNSPMKKLKGLVIKLMRR